MMHVTRPCHAFKTMMHAASHIKKAPEPHAAFSMDLAKRQPYTDNPASEQSLG